MKFEVTFEIEKDENLIVLSTGEARDLYNKLKQHFGDPPAPSTYPTIIYPQSPQLPQQPSFIPWSTPDTGTPYAPQSWTITCSYGSISNQSAQSNSTT